MCINVYNKLDVFLQIFLKHIKIHIRDTLPVQYISLIYKLPSTNIRTINRLYLPVNHLHLLLATLLLQSTT